ncbi:SDR family oxidoreductase [Nocardiopsis chromatogenes]|uniref:SDR family oxidoreductase n=1 Tax=Nocardiopsis chromatogenes TaxID=280239 RepID=UPI001EF9F650|nr:SDR family oxidoreductase [Nocardiopsis chromatogenes]
MDEPTTDTASRMPSTAVVTGGSRGIGRAVVERLADRGHLVAFCYAHEEDAAREVERAVADRGGRARAVRADVARARDVERLFAEAESFFADHGAPGRLDAVVANAGITASAPLAEADEEEFDRVMAANAKGTFLTLRQAARRMGEGGRVVAVTSATTFWPGPGESAYAASKAACELLARVASRELGPRGITVNSVAPGPTDTDLLRGAVPEEGRSAVAAMTPLGRLGGPGDVADAVVVLAAPEAGWLTGQTVRADGGLV